MSDTTPRVTKKQRGFFQRCLCCCGGGDSDDDDDDDRPPSEPAPLTLEEIAALQEQMRRGDAARRAEAEHKERDRPPTESEVAIRGIGRLGHVDVRITATAQDAWDALFADVPDVTPAHVVATLTQNPNVACADNLQVQITEFSGGAMLTINCKQTGADGDDMANWGRVNCQMSLTRRIERKPDGAIVMVDERTDMPNGGCKQLYQALIPLYQAMGVTSVSLSADEVGSYAWVRYGFRPSPEGWADLCVKIEARVVTLQDEHRIDAETAAAVRRLLASPNPNTIEAIANLDQIVPEGDKKLGFLLLNKNIWKGVLDLTDDDAMRRLAHYIR